MGKGVLEALPSTSAPRGIWLLPREKDARPIRGSETRQKKNSRLCRTRVHTQSFPLPLLKLLPREREGPEDYVLGALGLRDLSAF